MADDLNKPFDEALSKFMPKHRNERMAAHGDNPSLAELLEQAQTSNKQQEVLLARIAEQLKKSTDSITQASEGLLQAIRHLNK